MMYTHTVATFNRIGFNKSKNVKTITVWSMTNGDHLLANMSPWQKLLMPRLKSSLLLHMLEMLLRWMLLVLLRKLLMLLW